MLEALETWFNNFQNTDIRIILILVFTGLWFEVGLTVFLIFDFVRDLVRVFKNASTNTVDSNIENTNIED